MEMECQSMTGVSWGGKYIIGKDERPTSNLQLSMKKNISDQNKKDSRFKALKEKALYAVIPAFAGMTKNRSTILKIVE